MPAYRTLRLIAEHDGYSVYAHATKDTFENTLEDGYFDCVKDFFMPGDIIVIFASNGTGVRVLESKDGKIITKPTL